MKKNKLSKKILTEDYKPQAFEWMSKEYGHAEFILLPIVKRNKIREVHLYPLQQPNAKEYFVMKNKYGWDGIHFGNLLKYEKLKQPIIWTSGYDKKHKSFQFRFHVPKESKAFFITTGMGHCCINWR